MFSDIARHPARAGKLRLLAVAGESAALSDVPALAEVLPTSP